MWTPNARKTWPDSCSASSPTSPNLAGGGEEYLDRQAQATIQATTHAHTTWTRSNVRAEAQRLLRGVA